MGWITAILGFVKSLFAEIFMKSMETPAEEHDAKVTGGEANAPDASLYDGKFGVQPRDQD